MLMQSANSYNGHAFHESFNKGRASGILSVSEASVQFRNAEASVTIPMTGLVVKLGGASDRLIYITHSKYPDWTLYTSDRSLLKNTLFTSHPMVLSQAKKIAHKRIFNWSVLAVISILIVSIPLGLFLFMDKLTGSIASKIPQEWEQTLGEKAFSQYKIGHDFLDEATTLNALIQPLLVQASKGGYEFKVVISNDSELNAFALPGGFVVINSGLILKAKSADEMLGVLAHELSHVTQRHGMRNIIAASGSFLLVQALMGDSAGILATLAASAPFLLSQAYSREFEVDADEKGVDLLLRAKINPQGLVDFFTHIKREEEEALNIIEDENQRAIAAATLGFLSSHPATDDRIGAVEALIESKSSNNFVDYNKAFFKLQDRVKIFVTEGDKQ